MIKKRLVLVMLTIGLTLPIAGCYPKPTEKVQTTLGSEELSKTKDLAESAFVRRSSEKNIKKSIL